MDTYISVIDLGTGSIRNTIYDSKGTIITYRQKENPLIYPQPGWVEQDPVQWWIKLKETYDELPGEIRKKISAISVTSQREGMVPVNKYLKPLSNIIIWLDGRTLDEGAYFEDTLGAKAIYDITGLVPNPAWSLAKILWIRKNQPEIYQITYKFLQAEDYFISRLSGKPASEFSIASRTCMLDVKKRQWSKEILDTFAIDQEKLPELFESGTLLGYVDEKLAEEFGLERSVQIFTGAGDQQAAAVGVGAFNEGIVSIGIGTSSALSMTLESPQPDPGQKIILNCAAIPGKWEYEPPIWNTGGLIKWFYEQIEQEKVSYDELITSAEKVPPGSEGLIALPFFSGAGSPRWNPHLKGGFYGLTLSHQKQHFVKAIMESIAFEIKHNISIIEEEGIALRKIILSGGASRNLPLCQIIADVLQTEVAVFEETEASSKGVFLLVKSRLENKSLKDCVKEVKLNMKMISPDPSKSESYEKSFNQYIRLGDVLSQFKM